MKKNKITIIIVIILLLFLFFIAWGFYGANVAKDSGISCIMGTKEETLCWKWEKNEVGEIEEFIDDLATSQRKENNLRETPSAF